MGSFLPGSVSVLRIQQLTRQSPDSQGVYGLKRDPKSNIISDNDKSDVMEHAGTLGGPQGPQR